MYDTISEGNSKTLSHLFISDVVDAITTETVSKPTNGKDCISILFIIVIATD